MKVARIGALYSEVMQRDGVLVVWSNRSRFQQV